MSEQGAPQSRREARAPSPQGRARAAGPASASTRGIGGLIAKNPRAWLAGAIAVGFLILATGALFAGAAVGSNASAGTPSPSNSAGSARPLPAELPVATRLRTCSVAALAADPKLASFSGAVTNATTGELLFDRGAATGVPQGSALEVLTASAALQILGPDAVLTTRVYDGSSDGTIVLVGGGDPTLSQLPAGAESVYTGAPKLEDLAEKVNDAFDAAHPGKDIKNIVLDSSMWSDADKWDPTWKRTAQTGGTQSEVTALQVDGDRADPTKQVSPRSTDPVARAGMLFAVALGLDPDDITFSKASAITSKPVLGEVKSQPVSTLVNQMLMNSDGTLAENLARVVSKTLNLGGSAASLQQAITNAIGIVGVSSTGLVVHDGSGLSAATAIPPKFMADFLAKVQQGANNLNYVYNSLAVGGKSGSLAGRFTGANPAKGGVVGKPGAGDGEQSLVGVIAAADGTQLGFAFYAIGAKDNAKAAIDALVTGAFACGDNLSNN